MAIGLETDYRLRWMDFDRYGRIKPAAVLDLFQDVATMQAEESGIGRDDMAARGVFWVVARMRYEVVRQPVYHQHVIARTWPHSPSRVSFMRDYSLRDASTGEPLIWSSSEWVLITLEERKFASVMDYCDPDQDWDTARALAAKPRKIRTFDEEGRPALVVTPAYSDIDSNGHVNNAMYAKFALDALDPGSEGIVRAFQIDYRHEVLPGSELSLFTHRDEGMMKIKGLDPAGQTAFLCSIE